MKQQARTETAQFDQLYLREARDGHGWSVGVAGRKPTKLLCRETCDVIAQWFDALRLELLLG